MERTIFVTLSSEERKKYKEALVQARQLIIDNEPLTWCVAGFLIAKSACSIPWNFNEMNFDLDLDAVQSLFRMRNENQHCPVCGLDLVNIILPCNHAYCFSCLHRLHRRETFPHYPVCPRCRELEIRDFVVPSKKCLQFLTELMFS